MSRVVVVGAGVGGLATALCLSWAGHDVELLERDATPLPADAAGAFAWNRQGAPQVRHTHAFLARLRNLLRDRYPDVLAALLDAGATELRFLEMLPEELDRTPMPGDEDLVALSCRRTTFEWVLHRLVADQARVAFRHGVAVRNLVGRAVNGDVPPWVDGVELDDGTTIGADLVVVAGGRRQPVGDLLAPLGVDVAEDVEDTGIVYFSRFFHLRDGQEPPRQVGPVGGDLGYLKFGVFLGDNRTFSITLAARTNDHELRAALRDPAVFAAVAAELPATQPYVADGLADPISDVEVMAGLLNRRRRFTDREGHPLVSGFAAVGDAHTCTNPLYGRGCSLAVVQADLLADALCGSDEPLAVATAYEAACRREVLPWYRAAVAQDAATRADDAGRPGGEEDMARGLLRDGLLPALRTDPVVLRAFLRMFNLLTPPNALLTDADVVARVWASYEARADRPPEPAIGPTRDQLVAALGDGPSERSSTAVP